MTDYDRTTQDFGNIVSLDHVNLTVPDQQMSTLFHIVGMGHTRDPYMTVGLENMWVNIGREQFHLPTRDSAQVLRGPHRPRYAGRRRVGGAPRRHGAPFRGDAVRRRAGRA